MTAKTGPARRIEAVIEAVSRRGIIVELVESKSGVLKRLRDIIPPGASISMGASETLRQIGFEELLISGNHPWRNLKGEYLAEADPVRQRELRRQSILCDYFLGSVHAVTASGEILVASATGSQLAPYAYAAKNVVWIAGMQKIVSTIEEGLERIRSHVAPLVEELGLRALGRSGMGTIGKILLFENEPAYLQRSVRLILVKEVVGY